MAFYFCSGSAKKFERIGLGTFSARSNVKMSDKGYSASEYTKWTANNFYCINTGTYSGTYGVYSYDGDGDQVRPGYIRVSIPRASWSYVSETGILTVTPATWSIEAIESHVNISKTISAAAYLVKS